MLKKYLFLMILSTLICITVVSASTLTISYSWGMMLNAADIKFQGQNPTSIGVGEFLVTGDFSSPAYCIDYETAALFGNNINYTLSNPLNYNSDNYLDSTSISYAVWLMDRFSVGLGYDPNALNTNYSRDEAAAALQLAIWDAIYDFDGIDFDNGIWTDGINNYTDRFTYTPSVGYEDIGTLFNYFKTELISNINNLITTRQFKVAEIVNGQDILVVVPEPTTMMLFGFGLLGLGAMGRKKE